MRSVRIYQDSQLEPGNLIELSKEASHHLKNVLRFKTGEPLTLFNGLGGEYSAQLEYQGKKVFALIGEHHPVDRESTLHSVLLQGISKGERMDFSIQKAVELGANRIVPVLCQRTVVNLKADRLQKKMRHWQGIIINACEQSGRTVIPALEQPVKFSEINQLQLPGIKLTLDPRSDTSIHSLTPVDNSVNLLIGPEGGLTDEEIDQANSIGFSGIQLGPRILRTETAALAGITLIQSLWGDFSGKN